MSAAKTVTAASAAVLSLGAVTVAWLNEPALENKQMALYQAQCHTLHVSVMTELAKQGHYFKAGEAQRPRWVAAIYSQEGKGSANSAHIDSLAWDNFRVMPDGSVSFKIEDYRLLGETWKQAGKIAGLETYWGGDFAKLVDAVHTSCITPKGIR
jgi:hypothetical protein